jgi:hypothetical protein
MAFTSDYPLERTEEKKGLTTESQRAQRKNTEEEFQPQRSQRTQRQEQKEAERREQEKEQQQSRAPLWLLF